MRIVNASGSVSQVDHQRAPYPRPVHPTTSLIPYVAPQKAPPGTTIGMIGFTRAARPSLSRPVRAARISPAEVQTAARTRQAKSRSIKLPFYLMRWQGGARVGVPGD